MARTPLVVFWLLVSASAVTGRPPAQPPIPFGGTDFKQYYATGRLLLTGENPYDHARVGELEEALGAVQDEPQVPYGPPTSLLPFVPLGGLDFPSAVRVQLGLNVLLLAASGCLWAGMLFPTQPLMRAIGAACVFAWIPTLSLLGMGHVTGWTLFGFTMWCILMHSGRPSAAGATLALSIIKPHLALALVGYAMVYGLRRRQWRMIAAFAGTVLLMSLAVAAMRPTVWSEYVASLPKSDPTRLLGATLDGWGRYYIGDWFRWPSFCVTLLMWAYIGWFAWTDRTDGSRWPLIPALALAATPYAFTYDFVLALPGFILALGIWLQGTAPWRQLVLAGWFAVDAFYAVGKAQHWFEVVYFVIPWITAALTYVALRHFASDIHSPPRYRAP